MVQDYRDGASHATKRLISKNQLTNFFSTAETEAGNAGERPAEG
jgi:hypothetical protein